MSSNKLFALNTSDKLARAKDYMQRLSNDLAKNNSSRDSELSAAAFYMSSILFKMTVATNKNDIEACRQIAIELYSFYQNKVKGLA